MQQLLQSVFLRKLKKYNKLKARLEKKAGVFNSGIHRQRLLNKLSRLYTWLVSAKAHWKTASAAVAFSALSMAAQAQNVFSLNNAANPLKQAMVVNGNSHPFLLDFDNDGDVDMISGSSDGKIYYFENTGEPVFKMKTGATNPFDGIVTLGRTAITMADYNADGDLDLFIVDDNNISIHQNNGLNVFTPLAAGSNPFNGIDANSITFADFDGDLDLDAFIGTKNGSNGEMKYFSNTAGVFTEQTGAANPFNGIVDLEMDLAFADIDNDSDLDAFTGNKNGTINYYENSGGVLTSSGTYFSGVNLGGYTAISFGDVNDDGDLDAVIGSQSGEFHYYDFNGGNFTEVDPKSSPVAGGFFLQDAFYKSPVFADIDNDADLDAYVGTAYGFMGFKYQSGGFSVETPNPLGSILLSNTSAGFIDLDNDGDLDVVAGDPNGLYYYQNDGSSNFAEVTPPGDPFSGLPINNNYASIRFHDLDNDEDLDGFVPTDASGILYFQNDGAGNLVAVTGAGNPLSAITVSGSINLDFLDINSDGDEDVFISSNDGKIHLFLNSGLNVFSSTEETALNPFSSIPETSIPFISFLDSDNDGDKDAFIGGDKIYFYENTQTDVNNNPTIAAQAFSVTENSAAGVSVGTVIASDADAGQVLTYAISAGNDDGKFSINSSTGEIKVAGDLNFENTSVYLLSVDATDNDVPNQSSTAIVTVTIVDVNDAPEVGAQYFSVDENSNIGTFVGSFPASDQDAGQTLTYAITGGNAAGKFAINNNGDITVTGSLDYETEDFYSLTVTVTDDGTPVQDSSQIVEITINDLNETPAIADQGFYINESSSISTSVGTVIATDVDEDQTLTYAITAGNDDGKFAINISTGEITVAAGLDFATTPSYSLTVEVTDDGSPILNASATITITVQIVGTPIIAEQGFSIDENSSTGTSVGTVVATDVDAGQTLTYAITGGNSAGKFAISSTTGEITVAGSLDFETKASYPLTVEVTDNGSPNLSSSAMVTITITDIVEAGISNAHENNRIKIYPNPSSGEFNIDADALLMKGFTLSISNAVGKEVYNSEFTEQVMLQLPSGIYIIRFISENEMFVKQIVIQ